MKLILLKFEVSVSFHLCIFNYENYETLLGLRIRIDKHTVRLKLYAELFKSMTRGRIPGYLTFIIKIIKITDIWRMLTNWSFDG